MRHLHCASLRESLGATWIVPGNQQLVGGRADSHCTLHMFQMTCLPFVQFLCMLFLYKCMSANVFVLVRTNCSIVDDSSSQIKAAHVRSIHRVIASTLLSHSIQTHFGYCPVQPCNLEWNIPRKQLLLTNGCVGSNWHTQSKLLQLNTRALCNRQRQISMQRTRLCKACNAVLSLCMY